MRIRDASERDLEAIVEIYNSAVPTRISTADAEPVSVADRSDWFHEHDPARRPLWVMEHENEVVGWLSLGDFYDGRPAYHATAEVGVYVRENNRGSGVGQSLVEEVVRRASDLGLKTLTAGIFAHNASSIGLFEDFGFETWAHFPGVAELDGERRDLAIMGLKLQ